MREADYSMIYTKYPRVTALTLTMMMFAQCGGVEGRGRSHGGCKPSMKKSEIEI